MTNRTPYQLLGGEEGIRRLARTFYEVMDEMPQAETIRKMHRESLADIQQKLFEYLSGWLGGPRLYEERHGTVCLTDPHKPFAIGPAERDQWLLCMDEALKRVDASEEVRAMLKQPFFHIADFLRTREDSGSKGCSHGKDGCSG